MKWVRVSGYGYTGEIQASGELRRLVDLKTGRVLVEYPFKKGGA
ncbi:hypothetical protein LCGC14_2036230 [marine sediment metagenome]|uniref:Uncharacterized protein n=1 Tax=marine sediment metagenome TaxID=412755 RepID=A0A0F9ETI7_9ZZZZ